MITRTPYERLQTSGARYPGIGVKPRGFCSFRHWMLVLWLVLCTGLSLSAQIQSNINIESEYWEEAKELKNRFRQFKKDSLQTLDRLGEEYLVGKRFAKSRLREIEKYQIYERQAEEYQAQYEAYDRQYKEVKEIKKNIDWDEVKMGFERHHHRGVEAAGLTEEYEELAPQIQETKAYTETLKNKEEIDTLISTAYDEQKEELKIQAINKADEHTDGLTSEALTYQPLLKDKDSLKAIAAAEYQELKASTEQRVQAEAEAQLTQQLQGTEMTAVSPADLKQQFFPMEIPQGADLATNEQARQMITSRARQLSARTAFSQHIDDLASAYAKVDSARQKGAVLGTYDSLERKQTPFAERFVYGGNLQLQIGEVTNIDFSPWLGWNATKKLILGAGLTYRTNWDFNSGVDLDQEYGLAARVFTDFTFFKGFYAHLEGERFWVKSHEENRSGTSVVNNFLMGLGKTYTIHSRLKGNFQLLYNLTDTQNGPYESPWIVRFGVMIK